MTKSLQPQLTGIRKPLRKSLGFGFNNKIILTILHRAAHIAPKRYFCTRKLILRWMINIYASNIKSTGSGEMINLGLYPIRITAPFKIKILGNKLFRMFVFSYNGGLP